MEEVDGCFIGFEVVEVRLYKVSSYFSRNPLLPPLRRELEQIIPDYYIYTPVVI
jgi:hypothetical protein